MHVRVGVSSMLQGMLPSRIFHAPRMRCSVRLCVRKDQKLELS